MQFDTKLAEIGALKAKLLTMPRGLYEAREAAREARGRVGEAKKRVVDVKVEIEDGKLETLLLVSAERANGSDKPRYSNEAARNAAVADALAKSSAHQERVKRLAGAEADVVNAELYAGQLDNDVKRLEDEQREWRAVVDLTVAEVTLLVHGR